MGVAPCGRFMFLVTIVAVVCTTAATSAGAAPGARAVPVLPGSRMAAGPMLMVSSQLDVRRYAASGDRAYELGTEDGRYPAMGFHTRGEMGGIWTPPVKLLDGIWIGTGSVDVAATHRGSSYMTTVTAGLACTLHVGATVPAGATVHQVTLNGSAAHYAVRDTSAGREVMVSTLCRGQTWRVQVVAG